MLCKKYIFWTSFIHSWNSRTQLALIDIQFDQRKHKEFLRESDRAGKNLKAFLLLWQKLKWQKISICKCEHFLTFDLEKFSATWIGQVQSKVFYRLVAYELTGPYIISPYPVFHIKCQKEFTFANEYILPFGILS